MLRTQTHMQIFQAGAKKFSTAILKSDTIFISAAQSFILVSSEKYQ